MPVNNSNGEGRAKAARWRIVAAVISSALLSLVVGLLSNLAATYLAPSLNQQTWIVYVALILTFLCALPISIYLALRSLPSQEAPSSIPPSVSPVTGSVPSASQIYMAVQLPGKTYRDLIGRDIIIGDVMAALRDPSGKWMVGLDGMGGIGKTALAREIVERCLDSRLFDAAVWESASSEELGVHYTKRRRTLTFEMVLDSIGHQLGDFEVSKLRLPEKEVRVRTLLRNRRVLIILDNLETAKEEQNDIARRLRSLLDPSKAVLNSRRRLDGDLYSIHLTGLDEDGSIQFIRQECEEKGTNLDSAEQSELRQIAQVTGGSPLALKLVVGQINRLQLETVLNQLQNVRLPNNDNDESDYIRFYKHIFAPSWQLISTDAKSLLISLANFAPNVGGTLESVKATSNLEESKLTHVIDELWRFSLLEVSKASNLKQIRYYLHALTRYFVLSDIVKVIGNT